MAKNAVEPVLQESTAFWCLRRLGQLTDWLLFDIEEFYLEDEGGIGRDILAGATAAVGQFRGADKFGFGEGLHLLDSFGPAEARNRRGQFPGVKAGLHSRSLSCTPDSLLFLRMMNRAGGSRE
jgi:hypothetical protein